MTSTRASGRLHPVVVALAALLVAALVVPAATPAHAAGDRVAGGDRFATAVAISQRAFPAGSDTVYLARAFVFADALAAGVLTDGPILLVPDGCGGLPDAVTAEIARLDPTEVVALGGPVAICEAQLAAAAGDRATDRVEGGDRYATSVAVARRAFPDGAEHVYVASGGNSPDAVAGGALTRGPILLVPPGGGDVPAVVRDAVADLAPDRVVALGGRSAVSQEQLADAADGRSAFRLSGDDRFATAARIAEDEFDGRGVVPTVYLARGDVFADAVAAGSLVDGPVVLVPPCGALPDDVVDVLEDLDPLEVVALGGPAAVCDDLLAAADRFAIGIDAAVAVDGDVVAAGVDGPDAPFLLAVEVPRAGWFSATWLEDPDRDDGVRGRLLDPAGRIVDTEATLVGSGDALGVVGRADGPSTWFLELSVPRASDGTWQGDVLVSSHLRVGAEVDGEDVDTGPGRQGTGQVLAFDAAAGERYDVVLTDVVHEGGPECFTIAVVTPSGEVTDPETPSIGCAGEVKTITFDTPATGRYEVALHARGSFLRTTTELTRWRRVHGEVDGPPVAKPGDRRGRGLDLRLDVTERRHVTVWTDADGSGTTSELRDDTGDDVARISSSGGRVVLLEPGAHRLLVEDRATSLAAISGVTTMTEATTTVGATTSHASEDRRGHGVRLAFSGREGQVVDITVTWAEDLGDDGFDTVDWLVRRPSGNELRSGRDAAEDGDTFTISRLELRDDGEHVLQLTGNEDAISFDVTITEVP